MRSGSRRSRWGTSRAGPAATKINLFFAINTLFSLGMLRAAGWAHDAWSTNGMLLTEAVAGVAALVVFAVVARRVPGRAALPAGVVNATEFGE